MGARSLPDASPDARHSDAGISPLKVNRLAVIYGRHHVVDLVAERVGVKTRAAAVAFHLVRALVGAGRVLAREADGVGAGHQAVVLVINGVGVDAGDGD